VPSNKQFINDCVEVLKKEKIKTCADLGAGDGRVAIAIAKTGIKTDAYELNPYLSLIIRVQKIIFGLKDLKVLNNNFEKADFRHYQAVVVYLMPNVLGRIEEKLFTQMPKGSVVLSNSFKFKNHKPEKVYNKLNVYRL